MKNLSLGLEKALSMTLSHIKPLAVESIKLADENMYQDKISRFCGGRQK